MHRESTKRWLAWALFNSEVEELNSYQAEEIEQILKEMCDRTGIRFPADSIDKENNPIRLTLDPMTWSHRPLIAYVVTDLIVGRLLCPFLMRSMGFSRLTGELMDSADVRFWYKPRRLKRVRKGQKTVPVGVKHLRPKVDLAEALQGSNSGAGAGEGPDDDATLDLEETTSDGVFLLHGVGVGPLPYLDLLKRIFKKMDVPMLVIEVPYIALRVAEPDIRGPDATAEAIATALRSVNMERATIVSHSFGTVMTSWLLRHCRKCIHSVVLIDPVSLQLARADVAHAAIHRRPMSSVDVLLEYFVFREQSIAATLARHFVWHRNVIWANDLPKNGRAVAVLSENDVIVPSAAVKEYLKDHDVDCVWLEKCGHAGFIVREDALNLIVDEVVKRANTPRLRIDEDYNLMTEEK